MSRKTQVISISALIVAALVAGYFEMPSRASMNVSPPAESGVASDIRTTEPAANAAKNIEPPATVPVNAVSDAGASYQNLKHCVAASRELATTNALSDCSHYEGQLQFEEVYAQCLNGWMNVPNRKAAAEAVLKDSGCGDTTDIEVRFFEATKQAAQAGNADAQICYLNGDFGATREQPLRDADAEEYKRLVPEYFDAALLRGDWRVVQLMTKRSFHPGAGLTTQIPDIGERETIYKMTKLLRLGASGRFARILDGQLRDMIQPDLVPEAALPPDVIQRGDAWAQRTFNESFAAAPGLTERPTVCIEPMGMIDRLPGAGAP